MRNNLAKTMHEIAKMEREQRMAELVPCPFCGSYAQILHYDDNRYLPKCSTCDGMIEKWFATEEEAAAAWNRRGGSE